MALWEYKVITSGKGGFATPALLETYLNQLGKDEWEIIEFRAQPDNPLAFHGLARRSTQRDWTLEAAASAAAKAEADKLRAEFAAKFQAATGAPTETSEAGAIAADPNATNRDETYRRPRDTEHDLDPEALDDSAEAAAEEWPEADHLPTFFEAIRPHMRRNQKGPGHSVGLDYLVRKFELLETDLITALTECGFVVPEDEDDKPFYVEYDGDIYWLNINRRGELWINTREKPRPVFKVVKATPLSPEAPESASAATDAAGQPAESSAEGAQPAPEQRGNRREDRRDERRRKQEERRRGPEGGEAKPAAPAESGASTPEANASGEAAASASTPASTEALPAGAELLDKLRPHMRRSRGGWSGTISFLSRAIRRSDADLTAALAALGLHPATGSEKAPVVEIGELAYWINKDGRGGIWINVRERKDIRAEAAATQKAEEAKAAANAEGAPASAPAPAADATAPLPTETPAPTSEANATPAVEAAPAPTVAASAETATPPAPAPETVIAPPAPTPVPEVSTPVAAVETPAPAAPVETPAPVAAEATPSPAPALSPLAAARPYMEPSRAGAYAAETDAIAAALNQSAESYVAALVTAGLKVPEKAREKPFFVENEGDLFWLTRNAKGQLLLNAKESSTPKPRRNSRPRRD
ncbi:MAG: hypothetical protein HZA31_11770 [Opitutae bacterium]|nr:hypothetical protein [Opitutae bacterium]